MSEYKVVHNPSVLTCTGLGSCIAIALYDAVNKIGGLVHIMLPQIREAKNPSRPARFADSGIALLVEEMLAQGAALPRIRAKIFGGANMFPGIAFAAMDIGRRNITAVKEELQKRRIPLVAEDLGGSSGRTISFDTTDGSVQVRKVRGEEKTF